MRVGATRRSGLPWRPYRCGRPGAWRPAKYAVFGEVVWTGAAHMSVSIIFSAAGIIFKVRRTGDSRRSGDGPRFSGVQAIVRTARPARRPPWSET